MIFENWRARQFFPLQHEVLMSWKKKKSLKVAKFTESSQTSASAPGGSAHAFTVFFPKTTKGVRLKTKKFTKVTGFPSRKRSSLHRSCSSPPPGAVCRGITQSRLNFLSGEAVDLHRKGSAGVRNMRSARLFVFWALSNSSRWESTEVFACEVLKLICVSCFH